MEFSILLTFIAIGFLLFFGIKVGEADSKILESTSKNFWNVNDLAWGLIKEHISYVSLKSNINSLQAKDFVLSALQRYELDFLSAGQSTLEARANSLSRLLEEKLLPPIVDPSEVLTRVYSYELYGYDIIIRKFQDYNSIIHKDPEKSKLVFWQFHVPALNIGDGIKFEYESKFSAYTAFKAESADGAMCASLLKMAVEAISNHKSPNS